MSPGFKTGAPCHESTSAWMCEQTDAAAYAGGMVEEKGVGGGLSDMTLMEERMQLRGAVMINGFHPPVRAARALFDDRDGAFGIGRLSTMLWITVWTSRWLFHARSLPELAKDGRRGRRLLPSFEKHLKIKRLRILSVFGAFLLRCDFVTRLLLQGCGQPCRFSFCPY